MVHLKEDLRERGERLEALEKAKSQLEEDMQEAERGAQEASATAQAHMEALEKQVRVLAVAVGSSSTGG